MSYADIVFQNMCQDILDNGCDTKGEKVRPHWEDGTPAYTIKRFGVVNRYNLAEEFPALTLRKTGFRSCVDEILWIWQKKSNNIHDLNSHIWDSWADETGSIKRAYGYQLARKYAHHKFNYNKETIEQLQKEYPSAEVADINGQQYIMLDQVDGVIYDLRNNPYSRRIMTNIYNFDDLYDMALYPCAYSMTFNVISMVISLFCRMAKLRGDCDRLAGTCSALTNAAHTEFIIILYFEKARSDVKYPKGCNYYYMRLNRIYHVV